MLNNFSVLFLNMKGPKIKTLRNQITEGFKVPQTGLEPVRPCGHRILSPACLPVPPPGHGVERKTGFEPATPTLARLCSTS